MSLNFIHFKIGILNSMFSFALSSQDYKQNEFQECTACLILKVYMDQKSTSHGDVAMLVGVRNMWRF